MQLPIRALTIFLCMIVWAGTQVPGLSQGATLVVPSDHAQPVGEMVFSPDKKYLASAGNDYVLKVRTYPGGRELINQAYKRQFRDIDFSHDGRFVAAATWNQLSLINVGSGKVSWTLDYDNAERLAFHPNQDRLYLSRVATNQTTDPNGRDTLKIYALDYLKPSPRITLFKTIFVDVANFGTPDLMSFSPEGNSLLIAGNDEQAMLVDLRGEAASRLFTNARSFLPDGNLLYASLSTATTISLKSASVAGVVNWSREADFGQTIFQIGYRGMLAIDGSANYLALMVGKNFLVSGNYATGTLQMFKDILDDNAGVSIAAGPAGEFLYSGTKEYTGVYRLERNTLRMIAPFGPPVIGQRFLAAQGNNRGLVLAGSQGKNAVVNLFDRAVMNRTLDDGYRQAAAGSPDGRWSATVGNLGALFSSVKVLYLGTSGISGQTRTIELLGAEINQVEFSQDSRRVLVNGPDFLEIYNVADGKLLHRHAHQGRKALGLEAFFTVSYTVGPAAALSLDGLRVAFVDPQRPGAGAGERNVYCTVVGAPKPIWTGRTTGTTVEWSTDGQRVIVTESSPLARVELDADNGRELKRENAGQQTAAPRELVTSAGGQYQVIMPKEEADAYLVDWARGGSTRKLPGHTYRTADATFFAEDFVLTTDMAGKLRMWDARDGRLVADIVLFANRTDWAVLTPDGKFDASEGALKTMYYRIGTEFHPLERFYENFYAPGLLGALFARQNVAPAPAPISGLKPPPTIALTLSTGTRNLVVEDDEDEGDDRKIPRFELQNEIVTLTIDAEAPDDVISEIRVYHNDKLLGEGTRGLVVENDGGMGAKASRTYTIKLLPGDNRLRALAINSQRTESRASELLAVLRQPAATVTTEQEAITLHLVTIGIQEYKNSNYNLNYAQPDAEGFHRTIMEATRNIFSEVKDYYLLNEKASQAGVLATLEEVRRTSRPNDVLLFYYAGHGEMPYGQEGDFYLVLYDVTNAFGEGQGSARENGLSGPELQRISATIPAQKQLFVLDACKSANALRNMTRGMAEEKAIAQLARATGTHWITAAGSTQLAHELPELGHGIFTYALMGALSGKADSGDKRVTVNEIKAYISSVVPELAERYRGQAQYPNIFGAGQDFPVGVVR